jgi:protease II
MRRYLRDEFEYLAHAESAAVSRLLKSEAAYMRSALGPLNGLQMALYDEMRSRLPDEQITPSERFGDWLYYSRTTARQDLPQFCRRHVDGGAEQVVFDLAALADKHGYAALGAFKVSPDRWTRLYNFGSYLNRRPPFTCASGATGVHDSASRDVAK